MIVQLAFTIAGFGLGWIACHYTTVRHLVWTIRDMRHSGYVYDEKLPATKRAKTVTMLNET